MKPLQFNNVFTTTLPADPATGVQPRQVKAAIFSRMQAHQAPDPYLIDFSEDAAAMLGLTPKDCESQEFVEVFAGNRTLSGMDPHATCYGGHQFGNWAGQLGDGRALNLGEIDTPTGHLMLQLKGAGPTPYSRGADGFAVLRSSVREYLCSEAMHGLGISTTRALCLIGTGDDVMRDMFYDGHPKTEPGAVVCRLSSSFIRFGHFQMLMARNEIDLLRQFTEFVIQREFAHLNTSESSPVDRYLGLFAEVCERTANLMADWMRVGFVHGVMNTDNLSILGETIDYGPYGWLDDFNPGWTPNTTDAQQKRYRYEQQPAIAQWNLLQLANALLPLVGESKPLESILSQYAGQYEAAWADTLRRKLGLVSYDADLANRLLSLITEVETDMTLFFRYLGDTSVTAESPLDALEPSFYDPAQLTPEYRSRLSQWLNDYRGALDEQGQLESVRQTTMQGANPKYTLRNYLSQQAIDAAENGDYSQIKTLLKVMRKPYENQPEFDYLAAKRPAWARQKAGCSMLSCSS